MDRSNFSPGLRDLGHGAPYFHDGRFNTFEDVIRFYGQISAAARAGTVRNAAPDLSGISIGPADVARLVAFLKSLNEDYS